MGRYILYFFSLLIGFIGWTFNDPRLFSLLFHLTWRFFDYLRDEERYKRIYEKIEKLLAKKLVFFLLKMIAILNGE